MDETFCHVLEQTFSAVRMVRMVRDAKSLRKVHAQPRRVRSFSSHEAHKACDGQRLSGIIRSRTNESIALLTRTPPFPYDEDITRCQIGWGSPFPAWEEDAPEKEEDS